MNLQNVPITMLPRFRLRFREVIRLFLIFVVICCGLIVSRAAFAVSITDVTPGEFALLPEYCKNTMVYDQTGTKYAPNQQQAYWVNLMGQSFWLMHHYCWALIGVYRAEQPGASPNEREFLYRSGIDEIYFVIRNYRPADIRLLPELYTRAGQFYIKRSMPVQAIQEFEKAIQAKPDYWPPYVEIAETYSRIGLHKRATQALEAGLKLMPDEPRLKEAKIRLLGDKRQPPALRQKPPGP